MSTSEGLELSPQSISDFFKSASRRITITVWLVRIIAIFMLYLLLSTIWAVLRPEVKEFSNLTILIQIIILFIFVIILALLTLVAYASQLLTSVFPTIGNSAYHYFLATRAFVVNQIFGSIDLPAGFGADPSNARDQLFGSGVDPLAPLAYLLNKPQRVTYNTESMYGLILIGFILMIITGIGFIRRSSVYLSGLTLVISQAIIALAYLKGLTLRLTLDTTSITSLLGSTLFQLAFISYLYFEFSLQTGYLYNLTSPTLTRQERVGKQLSRLSEFRLGVTKLGTEEEQKSKEASDARLEAGEEEEKEKTALAAGSGSTSAKKYDADSLLFLLDSAQDSMFSKPGGEQERLTGRLQRYHDGLLEHDPDLDDKLGGSAEKAFNPFIVLTIVLVSLVIRVFLLLIFAWIVVNPEILLDFIALPPSITSSVEINEPEGLLLVLIPLVFLLIGGSYLISKLQDWVIKAEELIIEEGEIGRLLKAGKAIRTREEGEKVQEELTASQEEQPKRRRRRRRRPKKKEN